MTSDLLLHVAFSLLCWWSLEASGICLTFCFILEGLPPAGVLPLWFASGVSPVRIVSAAVSSGVSVRLHMNPFLSLA